MCPKMEAESSGGWCLVRVRVRVRVRARVRVRVGGLELGLEQRRLVPGSGVELQVSIVDERWQRAHELAQ